MKYSAHDNDAISQASTWQAKLSSDFFNAEQQSEFDHWLTQSEENLNAWQEVNRFWLQLDGLSEENKNFLDDTLEETATVHVEIDIEPVASQIKATFLTGWNFSRLLTGLAASVLLMFSVFYTQMPQYFADYYTAPGELRTFVLRDGSQITMNSDTAISVDYTKGQRNIVLHQGEAYFVAADDSARPFVVQTSAGRVRALGTEFDIKARDEEIRVTVFEHSVRVLLNSGVVMNSLPQGQQLVFNETSFSSQNAANLLRTESWRKQRIIFQDKPLSEVVAELSYYRAGGIFILDSKTKVLSITGVFDTHDTNIALATIEQSLPVTVHKVTEKLVFISAK